MQTQASDDPVLLLSHRCGCRSILRGLNAVAKKCDHAKQELTGMYEEQTVRWMHEQERLFFFFSLPFPDRTSNRKPPASPPPVCLSGESAVLSQRIPSASFSDKHFLSLIAILFHVEPSKTHASQRRWMSGSECVFATN